MYHYEGLYEKYVKRFLDILLSCIALVFLSVPLIITAILIRIKLGKPVIFVQERPGYHEKIIKLYKFRTMSNEKDLHTGKMLSDEERLSSFGRTLRRLSIDELPSLFNIIKGDLSIVGPRPLLVEYLPYYTEDEHHRHDVRPGLTGLAQVNGRNSLTWEEKFAYDLQYIKNGISFKNDFDIICKTVVKVIRKEDVLSGDELKKIAGRLDDERKNRS